MVTAKSTMTVQRQVVDLIPAYLVPKLARKHGVDKKSRSFTPWSHIVSLIPVRSHNGVNGVSRNPRRQQGSAFSLRANTWPSRRPTPDTFAIESS